MRNSSAISIVRPFASENRAHDELRQRYQRELGNQLRGMREARGLTQQEVADHLGITKSALSHYENARSGIAPNSYFRLAEILGVSPCELGKTLLRYSNPWLYAMVVGMQDQQLRDDLERTGAISARTSGVTARA